MSYVRSRVTRDIRESQIIAGVGGVVVGFLGNSVPVLTLALAASVGIVESIRIVLRHYRATELAAPSAAELEALARGAVIRARARKD